MAIRQQIPWEQKIVLTLLPADKVLWTGLVQNDSRVGWLRGLIDKKKADL